MSGKAMGWVWDCDLPRAEKYVLLAYADHADHQGRGIFPSVGLIAWKTGYDERHVKRIKKELLQKGILKEYGTSEYGTPVYALIKEMLPEREDYIQSYPGRPKDEKRGDILPPDKQKRGDISNKKGVTFCPEGVTPESPKPSCKPSIESKRENAHAHEPTHARNGRCQNGNGKVDYLEHMTGFAVNHQNGQERQTEPDDWEKFFGSRDKAVNLYLKRFGPMGNKADLFTGWVHENVDGPADLEALEKSMDAAILNWSGAGTVPLKRVLEVYEHGRGDYETFRQWKWQDQNGDKNYDLRFDEENEDALKRAWAASQR